jgi:Leucine-rich repeat (LRR) protein
MAMAAPDNHTACPFLAMPCNVDISLTAPAPVEPVSIRNAALLLGVWQGNASVTLRGQWGAKGLSTVLQHAHRLLKLDAAKAAVTSLASDTLAAMTSLRTLILSDNNMQDIAADAWSTLTALESLSLAGNMLGALPSQGFQNCGALSSLTLERNRLTWLHDATFYGASALRELKLSENKLTVLSAAIFDGLSALTALHVEKNRLQRIEATTFQALARLTHLYLSHNKLTHLPKGLFQGLPALVSLSLSNNELASVDPAIFQGLHSLQSIFLVENRLTWLPAALFQSLPTIITLHLNKNKLVELDAALFNGLLALESLSLSSNQLARLPDGLFDGLSALKRLYIYSNRLTHFDVASLKMLPALQRLQMGSNPLSQLADNTFSLPTGLPLLAQLWLDSTGVSVLELPGDSQLKYLKLTDARQLTHVRLPQGSRVEVADVTGTALRIADLPCAFFGYSGLVARRMPHMSSLDLLHQCMGSERQFLDISDNGEYHVKAVRDSLARETAQFLEDGLSSFLYPSMEPIRDRAVELVLVDSPVQCSPGMQERDVAINQSTLFGLVEPLQMFTCSCIPGYYEEDGVCRENVPFVATSSGIATVVLTTLAAAAFLVVCYKHVKQRLRRARTDLEEQRGLLEYAETEVRALKRAWDIEPEDVTLLSRIDGECEGAYGAVWRGDLDGMVVAVKVLRAGLLELNSGLADEFDREAEFLMRARHRNVVRFFGAGRMSSGEPFVVLELVSRGSLQGLLQGNPDSLLDGQQKRRLALDVTRGMTYIHSLGALHRDLKSGNVLVTETWRGKVADFGSMRTLLAAAAAGCDTNRGSSTVSMFSSSQSGASDSMLTEGVGTPVYMAPEVLRGDVYGEASDVWAFSVMVWELVEERTPDLLRETGTEARRGPPSVLLKQLLEVLDADKRLRLSAEAPAWARRVVAECMVAEPSERPSFARLEKQLVAEGSSRRRQASGNTGGGN